MVPTRLTPSRSLRSPAMRRTRCGCDFLKNSSEKDGTAARLQHSLNDANCTTCERAIYVSEGATMPDRSRGNPSHEFAILTIEVIQNVPRKCRK